MLFNWFLNIYIYINMSALGRIEKCNPKPSIENSNKQNIINIANIYYLTERVSTEIIDLQPQSPFVFLENYLLTRIRINLKDNLQVKNPHLNNMSPTNLNPLTNELSADCVNVHKNLVYIDDNDILEEKNINTPLLRDYKLTIHYNLIFQRLKDI